ncbi:MAG: hypothetical protein J7577_03975 [Sphingobacteriaceae bacterium]|nr:hypothetical protein [Sphingobacteriaceae bacterium]
MKYALFGYTYQHAVACLLLAMMDVERKIENISLEATVDHNFDDITIEEGGEKYFLQIKDFDNAKLDELVITTDKVKISKTWHSLSRHKNILFFKDIKIKANCKILGFSAQLKDGIYIISLKRSDIDKCISNLYRKDPHRSQLINSFLSEKLDERKLDISIFQLPAIRAFDTRLSDKSVRLARKILNFGSILHIEGKPGVGKSHLVAQLEKEIGITVLYRFWISNQDKYYKERLRYDDFKADLNKKLFFDQKERSEKELLNKLKDDDRTLIIDGLDHVENYHLEDLQKYIDFINLAADETKVIVLSRPLKAKLDWEKQILQNWNSAQTRKLLKEFYHISKYAVAEEIYKLSGGYPILVKYVAEEYKLTHQIPSFSALASVSDYYDQLFVNESGKQALALFLCCKGFFMQEEIGLFLDDFGEGLVREFVLERPYLFERRLNRLTLYHDSLLTYLRQSGLSYSSLQDKMNTLVTVSLLKGETRFQSRVGHFDLSKDNLVAIVKYYADVKRFKRIMKSVVDFEAIREFYTQLLEVIADLEAVDLNVSDYYNMALLLNIISRDHLDLMNGFHYTYMTALLQNGYQLQDITSSGYLFGMLIFIKSKDASMMYNIAEDRMRDTSRFYKELEQEIEEESSFFKYQSKQFNVGKIEKVLEDYGDVNYAQNLTQILVNLYRFPKKSKRMIALRDVFLLYIQGEELLAGRKLSRILVDKNWDDYRFQWILRDAKSAILALGELQDTNDYINLSLQEYLQKYSEKGSFNLWPEVLAYIRLALHQGRRFDINSISAFFLKYHMRHDYSLRSIPYALCMMEERGLIDWKESLRLLIQIQHVSEKGYRGLTQDYLDKHDPEFMVKAIEEFGYDQLKVSWFDMERPYIERLPEQIFDLQMQDKFYYYRSRSQFDVKEIAGLLDTSKIRQLADYIKYYQYLVTIKSGDPREQILKKHKIPYKIDANDAYVTPRNADESFSIGYFDDSNVHLVLEKKLSPVDVAQLHQIDNTAISFPEMFEVFPAAVLKTNMHSILKAALTGKSKHGVYPQSPRLLPGNLLKLISICGFNDLDELFESFSLFMELSMYPLSSLKIADADNDQ